MTPTLTSPHPFTPEMESDEELAKEEDPKEAEMDITDSTQSEQKSDSEELGRKSRVSVETPQGAKSSSTETSQGQKSQYGETPLPVSDSADLDKGMLFKDEHKCTDYRVSCLSAFILVMKFRKRQFSILCLLKPIFFENILYNDKLF